MIQSRVQVTVRYAETDMMGIVYHANYLPWFEVGRTTLLKEIGVPYKKLEEEGFRLPVLEISAKYLRPAVYDDTLEVVTTLTEAAPRIRLEYEVRRGDELLATGTSVHAFVDREGKPVRPPAWAVGPDRARRSPTLRQRRGRAPARSSPGRWRSRCASPPADKGRVGGSSPRSIWEPSRLQSTRRKYSWRV
jgi:acyl-CoA thioester hydrolase